MAENNRGNKMPLPEKAEVKEAEVPVDEVKPAAVAPVKIKVVALRDGFYKRVRRFANDMFEIDDLKQLGKWMKKI